MGLALGKDLNEIRQMPYPQFRRWQLYYALEPWGWENDEYRTAALLAMLYNAYRGKNKAKEPKHFIRDMKKEILAALKEEPDIYELTPEQVRAQIKKDLGIR